MKSHNLPETMEAMVLVGHGGLEQLQFYADYPTPTPAAGDVIIKVGACGLNSTDINTRTAWYADNVTTGLTPDANQGGFDKADASTGAWGGKALTFPLIQGADVCGEIVAVGDDVDLARLGERVLVDPWLLGVNVMLSPANSGYFGSEYDGGFAQYTKVRAANAVPIESSLSDAELATFPCAYTTAEHLALRTDVQPGETVVISGASGGVGSAAVQLCRLRGARVIAIASAKKVEGLLELGASAVIDRHEPDLATAICDSAAGKVDVALDVVGSNTFTAMIHSLRHGGRYASAGALAGPMATLDLRQLVYKDLQLRGATIVPAGTLPRLVKMVESGQLKALLAATYPLKELRKAQEVFMMKGHTGNIVVVP